MIFLVTENIISLCINTLWKKFVMRNEKRETKRREEFRKVNRKCRFLIGLKILICICLFLLGSLFLR